MLHRRQFLTGLASLAIVPVVGAHCLLSERPVMVQGWRPSFLYYSDPLTTTKWAVYVDGGTVAVVNKGNSVMISPGQPHPDASYVRER